MAIMNTVVIMLGVWGYIFSNRSRHPSAQNVEFAAPYQGREFTFRRTIWASRVLIATRRRRPGNGHRAFVSNSKRVGDHAPWKSPHVLTDPRQ
jgi:hypothetical protein